MKWSGLFLQISDSQKLRKMFKFKIFRLQENAFVNPLPPSHDLIITPKCRTILHKFFPKILSPICYGNLFFKKRSPKLYEGDTVPLPN